MALETCDDFITFTASQWVESIADIAGNWLSDSRRRADIHHLTLGNRGRSHAIILLLMVMLESYSQRAAADTAHGEALRNRRFDVAPWWSLVNYSDKDGVLDALALRNVLAHNHLYSYSLVTGAGTPPDFNPVSHFNLTFTSRVTNGKLKHTGMNCVPEMIGPHEVIEVSRIVRGALGFLRGLSTRIGPIEFTFVRRAEFGSLWQGIELAANLAIEHLDSKVNS